VKAPGAHGTINSVLEGGPDPPTTMEEAHSTQPLPDYALLKKKNIGMIAIQQHVLKF